MKRLAALLLCLATLASCRSTCCDPGPAAPVQHVVLVWLDEPGDADARRTVLAATRALEAIPQVVDVQVGEALPSEREVVDDSFDVGFVMRFASPGDLATYETHPDHVRAVEEVLQPLVARIVVYDLVERDAD